ncbi:MAG: DsbA family protein [Nitrospinae bacterium]|nr:DsbA family protein [Nitrospinota bacterium]
MDTNLKSWQNGLIKRLIFRLISSVFVYIHIILILILIPACGGKNEIKDIKKEVSEIKEGLSNVTKELQEVKKSLETFPMMRPPKRPPIPTVADVSIDDDPRLGDSNAPLTLIEFSEFQCPYCARFHNQIFPKIKMEYIDTGKLFYIFRDYPLSIHKDAEKSAEAANCAGDQGKYWEMNELLFNKPQGLEIDKIKGYAKELDLKINQFNDCLDNGKYTEEIKKDIMNGQEAGVRGTPSFILGKSTKDGKIKGTFMRRAMSYETFKIDIDNMLKDTYNEGGML